MALAERDLVGEGRGPADGEVVRHAAPLLHREGRAAAEVDRAAERIGAAVRRVALDQLEALEHRAGEVVDAALAGHRALGGEHPAVEGDVVQVRAHPAHGEAVDAVLEVEGAGHAGEQDRQLARAHIRQVPVGIHRDHIFDVGRVALGGDGRGAALALARDGEGLEAVDARGEREVEGRTAAGRHGERSPLRVEAGVGGGDLQAARGQAGEFVAARLVREGRAAQRREGHAHALQAVAGGGVAHVARQAARGLRRAGGRRHEGNQGEQGDRAGGGEEGHGGWGAGGFSP